MQLPIVRWGCALANAFECVFSTERGRFPIVGIVAIANQLGRPEFAGTIADPLLASAGLARPSCLGIRLLPTNLLV